MDQKTGLATQSWRFRNLISETIAEWREDRVPRLGAALAYYAFFSVGPLLYLAVFVAATVYGNTIGTEAQVRKDFEGQLASYVGPQAAGTILDLMHNALRSRSGVLGSVISVIGLVFAGTGAVVALKDALNTIWGVTEPEGASWWWLVRDRILSLVIVAVVGALLLVSLVLSAALVTVAGTARDLLPFQLPLSVVQIVNYVVSFVVITLLFAAVFRFLPDVVIGWRDVLVGAAITALLFLVGKGLFELYLSHVAVGSTFGSAGALAILLLFAYYSAQVFLLGAEFTQVYARELGTRIRPRRGAVWETEAMAGRGAARKQQRQAEARQAAESAAR